GEKVSRLTFEDAGMSNFVFSVKAESSKYFIRISPTPTALDSFIKEQWVQARVSKEGIPVAPILETGSSVIPFPYMISEAAAGVAAADHSKRTDILRELGRYAARINAIRVKGYGETYDWSENKLSYNRRFKEFLKDEWNYESRISTLDRFKVCPAETLALIRKAIAKLGKRDPKPVLIHGDLRLKNTMVDEEGRITAILDWEMARSGIFEWELSVALHDLGIDEKNKFIEGYGLSAKKLAESASAMKLFNILNYAIPVEKAAVKKDKRALEQIRMRLAGDLDLYSLR
ncbi:MAG TPA: aminoglycoside phosphotransferase family protein, partial [Pyrinomonadaceae bacterium]|nr:aminoglycoside phosphotransferase family protein [Pyrinomonadaceae bacterium]